MSLPFLLLADDDEDLLRVMALELGDEFSVLEASSFEQGVALLNEVPEIVVAVADLRLLPGPTGADLLAAVARRVPECARVLISASRDSETIAHALRTGAAHRFLHKPWSSGALHGAIAEARSCATVRCIAAL